MDLTPVKEFEPMQLQYAVTEELRVGIGKIGAVNRLNSDEAEEVARDMREDVEEVELGTGCGCIDGRCVVHLLDGEESKNGPSTAGGVTISALMAMELTDAFNGRGNVYDHLSRTINMLEDGQNGVVRFHIDSDHEDEVKNFLLETRDVTDEMTTTRELIDYLIGIDVPTSTGCGMDDQLEGASANMAAVPRTYEKDGEKHTETEEEVMARLEAIKGLAAAVKADKFSEAEFDAHVATMTALVEKGHFNQWNSRKALALADRILRDRGVENGIFPRLEVLETSDEGVHGHVEDVIGVNKREGTSLNQTNYVRRTGRMAFWYDEWVADKVGKICTRTQEDSASRLASISQGITETNMAGAYQLIDGTQRAVIYS